MTVGHPPKMGGAALEAVGLGGEVVVYAGKDLSADRVGGELLFLGSVLDRGGGQGLVVPSGDPAVPWAGAVS